MLMCKFHLITYLYKVLLVLQWFMLCLIVGSHSPLQNLLGIQLIYWAASLCKVCKGLKGLACMTFPKKCYKPIFSL